MGARLVYNRVSMPRALSFEYLNRQLVWHELSELLLFVLPLINVTRLKGLVLRNLPSISRAPLPAEGSALGMPVDWLQYYLLMLSNLYSHEPNLRRAQHNRASCCTQ